MTPHLDATGAPSQRVHRVMTPDPCTMGEDSLLEDVAGSWSATASSAGPVVRAVSGLEQACWRLYRAMACTTLQPGCWQQAVAFVCNKAPRVRRYTSAISAVVHSGESAEQPKPPQA